MISLLGIRNVFCWFWKFTISVGMPSAFSYSRIRMLKNTQNNFFFSLFLLFFFYSSLLHFFSLVFLILSLRYLVLSCRPEWLWVNLDPLAFTYQVFHRDFLIVIGMFIGFPTHEYICVNFHVQLHISVCSLIRAVISETQSGPYPEFNMLITFFSLTWMTWMYTLMCVCSQTLIFYFVS